MKNNNVVTNMVQDFDDNEKRQGRENIDAAKTVQAFTSSGSLAASGDVQIIGDQMYVGSTSVGHLVDDLDKYYLATNPSGFITSADLNGYATQEWVEDYVSGFGPAGSNFSGFYNYTGGDYPLDRIDIYPHTNGQGYTYNEISVHGADTTTWIGSLLPDGGASPGKVLGFTSGGYEWVDQTGGMSAEMWDGQGNETQIDGLIFNQGPNEVYADTNGDGEPDVLLGNLVPTVSGASQGQVLGYLGNGELGWVNQQGGGTGGTPIYDAGSTTVQVSGMTFDHSTSNGMAENEIFVNENGSNVSMGLTVPTAGRASGKILSVTNGTGALGWINQPTIPVTSAFITASDLAASGYAPAEQSDWAEVNSADLAYIKNKPVESWLLEGDNVYFTETSAGLMINASASGGADIYLNYGIITTDVATSMSVDMLASKQVRFNTAQGVQSTPGYFVPEFSTSTDEGKKLVAGPDGYPIWEKDSPVDWYKRYSSSIGSLSSTKKLETHSIDDIGDSTEIWGTATIQFNTSGTYALCPADVTTELTKPSQCLNLSDISAGIHTFNFCFQADHPGDIRYLEIKGQSSKTASDVDLLYLATQNKRAN